MDLNKFKYLHKKARFQSNVYLENNFHSFPYIIGLNTWRNAAQRQPPTVARKPRDRWRQACRKFTASAAPVLMTCESQRACCGCCRQRRLGFYSTERWCRCVTRAKAAGDSPVSVCNSLSYSAGDDGSERPSNVPAAPASPPAPIHEDSPRAADRVGQAHLSTDHGGGYTHAWPRCWPGWERMWFTCVFFIREVSPLSVGSNLNTGFCPVMRDFFLSWTNALPGSFFESPVFVN